MTMFINWHNPWVAKGRKPLQVEVSVGELERTEGKIVLRFVSSAYKGRFVDRAFNVELDPEDASLLWKTLGDYVNHWLPDQDLEAETIENLTDEKNDSEDACFPECGCDD